MKVVILAGGFGTRLSEETIVKPKPLVEIGGRPLIWHIMKLYEFYGFNDFVICLGYKGHLIKDYFINYYKYNSDLTVNLEDNSTKFLSSNCENFKVTLIDTGLRTNTAGRIQKIKKYTDKKSFMLTYGDGVSNVNINELIKFHKSNNKLATLTSSQMPGRFGTVDTNKDGLVTEFKEKLQGDEVWINSGFFVLEQGIFDYLERDDINYLQWEKEPLTEISNNKELCAFKHDGFWKCMDSIRDKSELEKIWSSGKVPWKVW